MKRVWTRRLALAAVLLALGGCSKSKPGTRVEQDRMAQASRENSGPGGAMADVIERGEKKARVKIEAYYPLNQEHQPIADLVLGFAEKYPGEVYVRVADFRSDQGKKLWYDSGLTCGGIQINGKSEILLEGKKEPTRFLQAIDVYWTQEELEAAVAEAVKAARSSPSAEGK